jgi:hypothetical protein
MTGMFSLSLKVGITTASSIRGLDGEILVDVLDAVVLPEVTLSLFTSCFHKVAYRTGLTTATG